MQKLTIPYRAVLANNEYHTRNGESRLFSTPHQKNLFTRHYAPETDALLSVILICRTLAMPGDWLRRINPDYLGVTYIHSGETLFRIGEESFVAESGDLVLLPPGTDYEFGTRTKAVRSGIIVQGSIVEQLLANLRGKYVFTRDEAPFAEEKMALFFNDREASSHQLSLQSFDLLALLKNKNNAPQLPGALQKAVQKIKKHREQYLSLENLARESGVSPRTLTRLFQKHLHISPHQYLIQERMKSAARMLDFGELAVKEIAISSGYSDVLNFSTAFRRFFGCSPSEYRKQKK